MTARRKLYCTALVASFSVYFLPVATAHVVFVWGWALAAEIFASENGRGPSWLVADMGLAVMLQACAFALFAWILSGRARRWLALIPAAPAFETVLIWAYLVAIPSWFLIEPETAPEVGDWPIACRIEDATLLQVSTPPTLDLTRAQQAWIGRGASPQSWHLLTGPDCHLETPVFSRPSERGHLIAVVATGAALFTSFEGNPPITRYWHLDPVSGAATELTPPPDQRYWVLTLSRDGRTVGWLETRREGRSWDRWLQLREITTGRERQVPLSGLGRGSPEILALDGIEGRVILTLESGQVLALDSQGELAWGPVEIGEIQHFAQSFVWLDDGWVAWEIYRDEGRLRLIWDLPSGRGRREIPKGSGITDVAVSADGRLIAVSTTTNLNLGSIRDSFFVLRSRDGTEVYRRFFPPYTRTRMAFLGSRQIVLTRIDPETGEGRLEVLVVPDESGS